MFTQVMLNIKTAASTNMVTKFQVRSLHVPTLFYLMPWTSKGTAEDVYTRNL